MNDTSTGGIGFAGALTIVFIGLKLANIITWSWWWVLSPLWISFLLGVVILIIVGAIFFLITIHEEKERKKRKETFLGRK